MLSDAQKRTYALDGYLLVNDVVCKDHLSYMQGVARVLIDASREVTRSDVVYGLDRGHSPREPRLTRIAVPEKIHVCFDEALRMSGITEVLRDLLGPDVALVASNLEIKAPKGGPAIEWRQDWAFHPHTNDDLLTVGLMLEDVDSENGPLMVIPGSHRGPVLEHHANGIVRGAIDPDDPLFEAGRAVPLTGRAGCMTVHHARLLHGVGANMSDRARVTLSFTCSAADAWPLNGGNPYTDARYPGFCRDAVRDRMVTGEPCFDPRMEKVPVTMPLPAASDAGAPFGTQRPDEPEQAFSGGDGARLEEARSFLLQFGIPD